jgi:septin family protein
MYNKSLFINNRTEKDENAKFAEEEEQLRKDFTEKVKAEESRFRQWEQQVSPNLMMNIKFIYLFIYLFVALG